MIEPRRPPAPKLIGFVLLLCAVSWGLGAFAAYPWRASDADAAVVRVAFRHVATFAEAGAQRSQEEIEKLPLHMRPASAERGRRAGGGHQVPEVDGRSPLERTYSPSGLRHDGPASPARKSLSLRGATPGGLAERGRAAGAGGAARRWRRGRTSMSTGRAL
jgi:hypothetical protein